MVPYVTLVGFVIQWFSQRLMVKEWLQRNKMQERLALRYYVILSHARRAADLALKVFKGVAF